MCDAASVLVIQLGLFVADGGFGGQLSMYSFDLRQQSNKGLRSMLF